VPLSWSSSKCWFNACHHIIITACDGLGQGNLHLVFQGYDLCIPFSSDVIYTWQHFSRPKTHKVLFPCHWGVVDGGCVVVCRPHPSHPFTKFHPTFNETAHATREKIKIMTVEKSMSARWRGWLCHPITWELLCGILKVPVWFLKSPTEFPASPFDEGLSLNIFHPRFVSGWIRCEVFQALLEGGRSRNLGQHKRL